MKNSASTLPSLYSEVIYKTRYAKWLPELGRREHFQETVDRYVDFMAGHVEASVGVRPERALVEEIREAILRLDIMPSMRALMTAGPALAKNHVAAFNCSYLPIEHPRDFDELLYILMSGTGVGFSVERQYVSQLPIIPEDLHDCDIVIKVRDSKRGWAQAFRQLLALLWAGQVPSWDVSGVRPAGARLKTFGGRASGPQPLVDLFEYTVRLFHSAKGRRLESIEAHDLCCMVADIVVVGGVRRSALISLSNLSDQRMRAAKTGQWWASWSYRRLANNSVAYDGRPPIDQFMEEWTALYKSYSGERGIFNRAAAKAKCREIDRDDTFAFGTNPCGEIVLRPHGFCNLTEVVARPADTKEQLLRKVALATILGTWQSTLTDFKYIRSKWKKNAEEERLLGVSITGIMDHPLLNGSEGSNSLELFLQTARSLAREYNKAEAENLNIRPSAAITCVKPSGTVSQLVDSASGIHQRFADRYIRRIRNDLKDPLTQFLVDAGVPHEVEETSEGKSPSNMVFSFPIEAPEGSDVRERPAIEQLEFWLIYRKHWCDHNPSTTIYVKEDEWMAVGAWVFEHFDEVGGLSFLPYDGGSYRQAPYERVSPEEFEKAQKALPESIDWADFVELEDTTVGSQELACSAGVCEI